MSNTKVEVYATRLFRITGHHEEVEYLLSERLKENGPFSEHLLDDLEEINTEIIASYTPPEKKQEVTERLGLLLNFTTCAYSIREELSYRRSEINGVSIPQDLKNNISALVDSLQEDSELKEDIISELSTRCLALVSSPLDANMLALFETFINNNAHLLSTTNPKIFHESKEIIQQLRSIQNTKLEPTLPLASIENRIKTLLEQKKQLKETNVLISAKNNKPQSMVLLRARQALLSFAQETKNNLALDQNHQKFSDTSELPNPENEVYNSAHQLLSSGYNFCKSPNRDSIQALQTLLKNQSLIIPNHLRQELDQAATALEYILIAENLTKLAKSFKGYGQTDLSAIIQGLVNNIQSIVGQDPMLYELKWLKQHNEVLNICTSFLQEAAKTPYPDPTTIIKLFNQFCEKESQYAMSANPQIQKCSGWIAAIAGVGLTLAGALLVSIGSLIPKLGSEWITLGKALIADGMKKIEGSPKKLDQQDKIQSNFNSFKEHAETLKNRAETIEKMKELKGDHSTLLQPASPAESEPPKQSR